MLRVQPPCVLLLPCQCGLFDCMRVVFILKSDGLHASPHLIEVLRVWTECAGPSAEPQTTLLTKTSQILPLQPPTCRWPAAVGRDAEVAGRSACCRILHGVGRLLPADHSLQCFGSEAARQLPNQPQAYIVSATGRLQSGHPAQVTQGTATLQQPLNSSLTSLETASWGSITSAT